MDASVLKDKYYDLVESLLSDNTLKVSIKKATSYMEYAYGKENLKDSGFYQFIDFGE